MKRVLALLVLVLAPAPARAYLDASPTLGKLVRDAPHIVVLQVDAVSREKQALLFKKIADLKGKDPEEVVKHRLTAGFHPRQARSILDWAEPGSVAVCFHNGRVCQTCIGGFWYECSLTEAPWWTMTTGKPELSYAYRGSPARLRDHVKALLAGREVIVTALAFQVLVLSPGTGKWVERKIDH